MLDEKRKKLKEMQEMYSKNLERFPNIIINKIFEFQKNQDAIQGAIKFISDEIKELEEKIKRKEQEKAKKIEENLAKKQ